MQEVLSYYYDERRIERNDTRVLVSSGDFMKSLIFNFMSRFRTQAMKGRPEWDSAE